MNDRNRTENKTVGVSPKAPAAAAAALVAPLVVRLLGKALDVDIDSETVEGLILAATAAIGAGAAAYSARHGAVVRERAEVNETRTGR